MEQSTYDIIRKRLGEQKKDLVERLNQLADERRKVFGSVAYQLLSNDRISTENSCLAADMIGLDRYCLFGYNVHFGLRNQMHPSDVFNWYELKENKFNTVKLNSLEDPRFIEDFENLYKYYRNTQFKRFVRQNGFLYMVFQLSESVTDIKAFKWLIEDTELRYLDNRAAHEIQSISPFDFEWTKATRDMFREGLHPHVSINEKVFVETIGGDLTIKVEDNTDDGLGIYREEVEYKDQTLDDGEIHFADLGNLVLLRIRPYQEKERYFIYSHKVKQVQRVNGIAFSTVRLPMEQGIIFPGGYYLQSGEFKIFNQADPASRFLHQIAAPNGEDYLFVFYNANIGEYQLYPYNTINQTTETPIFCNAYCLFPDGELAYIKVEPEPNKHHPVQLWQSPFRITEVRNHQFADHPLFKIGNKSLVNGMAECHELITLMNKEDNYEGLYEDIVKISKDITDSYFWITEPDTFDLAKPLNEIKLTANTAIDEFEKVKTIRRQTKASLEQAEKEWKETLSKSKNARFESVEEFVELLTSLRLLRGKFIELKSMRYADVEWIETQESKIIEESEKLAEKCAQFLTREESLIPYQKRINEETEALEAIQKVTEANDADKRLKKLSSDLELLIEIINSLNIEDSTQSATIIERISQLFSRLNQLLASLRKKRKSLMSKEMQGQFRAQMTLLEQTVANYLDLSDSPEKCEEYLTKLSLQLEEMDGIFAEFDEFLQRIQEKREEIQNAFESKKIQLVEALNRRTNQLLESGKRILKGANSKAASLKTIEEINAYFASDILVEKLRNIIQNLTELNDSAKAESLATELKNAREDAVRQLKDKSELFTANEDAIQLGNHAFSVNRQKTDLTLVLRDDNWYYHLTGTGFFERVDAPELYDLKEYWALHLPSESPDVYRAEYLAFKVLKDLPHSKSVSEEEVNQLIEEQLSTDFSAAYVKGVHDQDAAKIIHSISRKGHSLDLLRYDSQTRTYAKLFWLKLDQDTKEKYLRLIRAQDQLKRTLQHNDYYYLIDNLVEDLKVFKFIGFNEIDNHNVANYLMHQLSQSTNFPISLEAATLYQNYWKHLKLKKATNLFSELTQELVQYPEDHYQFLLETLKVFSVETSPNILKETAGLFIANDFAEKLVHTESAVIKISGLKGQHKILSEVESGSTLQTTYHEWMEKMHHHFNSVLPSYQKLQGLKHHLMEEKRLALRLQEFQPKVLSSFIRNQLINKVYLPLIGANFAKQIGTSGTNKRTDRQGMLLLVSPPGYGKTTLIEYIASRLGLVFMKINGPSIGHHVVSTDPTDAPNATAAGELKKLNLAFEMGDNVLLYLDDIQHCNPEFLQKFISLADGQRKIEGVYNGQTKTYDLRGKRFAVVMAGNPYTESGERFKIPDMLANRADIYNLGDIIGDTRDLFELSLLENSLSANSGFTRLIASGLDDFYSLLNSIEQNSTPELIGNYTTEEIREFKQLIENATVARKVVLQVNENYIRSAAMSDEYRDEPAFKLQGSYRDMNKLVEKLSPLMNNKEVKELILTHYENESQTLTQASEFNLLKIKELLGVLNETESQRLQNIRQTFLKNKKFKGLDSNDRMAQLLVQLAGLEEGLEGIRNAIKPRP